MFLFTMVVIKCFTEVKINGNKLRYSLKCHLLAIILPIKLIKTGWIANVSELFSTPGFLLKNT